MTKRELEIMDTLDPSYDFEIPEGWSCKRLRDGLLNDIQTGFACGENTRDGHGIPHLRPMNVNRDGNIDLSNVKFVPLSKCTKPGCFIELDDVIFNNTNSPALVGKTAHYNLSERRAFSNHMTRLRCKKEIINPIFCAMILHQKWREGYFESVCNNHVSQSSVGREVLLDTKIPLPPLPEQHRIITKVEELFIEVDAARDRLNKVPEILKHFKQAILAAACLGRLTEEWRECHPEIIPTSKAMDVFFKSASDDNSLRIIQKRTKNKEISVDFEGTFDIPDSWCWTRLENLAAIEKNSITDGPFGSNLKTEHYSQNGPRVIRLQNIGDGFFIDIKTHITQSHFDTLRKHEVFSGDIVIGLLGDPIPRSCIIPNGVGPAIVKADCIRFKPIVDLAITGFLNYALNESDLRSQVTESVHGVARPRLNLTQIKNFRIPLPPLEEQHEIVRRVESLFALADEIERQVVAATKCTDGLRQAILAKAFRGELVPTEAELGRKTDVR